MLRVSRFGAVAASLLLPAFSTYAEVATHPALQQLWDKLGALSQEKQDLAWRRWQALDDIAKAQIIVKPTPAWGDQRGDLAVPIGHGSDRRGALGLECHLCVGPLQFARKERLRAMS